jgi:molybdopterin synthase sulfur carrier subunit
VADVTDVTTQIAVTVRFFAAARAASGVEDEVLTVPAGSTVATLTDGLAARSAELARVLQRCSYLCDGVAVRNPYAELAAGQTVDVLPPFAGG